jgi:DNA-binding HxlR family transcriptional regulator
VSADESLDARLDPLIHEAGRLVIVSVLNECDVANFNFLLSTTRLTRGNLSTHMRKLVEGGYVDETKEIIDRKLRTEYRLTKTGRSAFKKYRNAWIEITNGAQRSAPGTKHKLT